MSLPEICVKRPVFAAMLISFLVVLGIFSFRDLGVDLFPKADPASVNVMVSLPGATPEELNSQVVLPLEEAISSVSGMDELTSQANEGNARITCKFTLERDLNGAAQDIRERVATSMRNLPPNVLPPVITKIDPDQAAVFSILVAGSGSLRETTEFADKVIRRALETVDGVGAVNLTGGRLRQIRVFADAEKLNAYGLTIRQFENAIQNENVEVPGGTVRRGDRELGVRTLARMENPDDFNGIIVANANGAPIRIRDVGHVEDSYPEQTTWNFVHGKEAVTLDVQRQFGANTLEVIGAVKAKLEGMQSLLPPGISIEVLRDNSKYIRASVSSLEEHLLFGALLASLVVLLFIRNLRSVIIAAVAIPASIIATFTLLKVMDFTLNNMTLLALTLAVGIVIDDIGDDLCAHRVHDGVCAPLFEPIRLDYGLCGACLDAGELHADAHALFAAAKTYGAQTERGRETRSARGRRSGTRCEGPRCEGLRCEGPHAPHLGQPFLREDARVVARSSLGGGSGRTGNLCAHYSAEFTGWARFYSAR